MAIAFVVNIVALGIIVAFGGWVLGIAAFRRTRHLRRELDMLRGVVERLAPQQVAQAPLRQAPPARPAQTQVDQAPASVSPHPMEPALPREAPSYAPPIEPTTRQSPPEFEALLAMRWGIWLGAAALLLAGVFLIRYAVDQGLLGPAIRCCLAGVLGAALLAAAELSQRKAIVLPTGPFAVDQAPPGLAAGGVAVLLGAAYGAGPYYGLLPPLLAFLALAAASAVGLAASLRFGQLTAAIGIAGAFLTPALVATPSPSLPGLFAYLFAVSTAAIFVVRHTAWTWLGWASVAAGAGWVCAASLAPSPDLWAAAAFVPAAALLNLAALPAAALGHPGGRRLFWLSFVILAASGLLLEAAQDSLVLRVMLLLLGPIAVWKGRREPQLDRLPWLAAGVGLAVLLIWALPAWEPSANFTGASGLLEALLPGTWAPQVIRPLLIAALALAAFNLAAGLITERTAPAPLNWATLAAATPVLTLAVTYAQVARFQTDAAWALAAAFLAAILTGAAASACRRALSSQAKQCAGIHAAGAIAALALGCAMSLHDQWLTLALALFLPALPWIEARADLPQIRVSALAVAGVVLARLVLNGDVLFYEFGRVPFFNGLIAAYGLPAVAFGVAAFGFRRRADDRLVAILEAGAVLLTACFVASQIRHVFGHGTVVGVLWFTEASVQLFAISLLAAGLLYASATLRRPVLRVAALILGGAALLAGAILLLGNPAFSNASAGVGSLTAAYAAPAGLALLARRRLPNEDWRTTLLVYGVVSGFAWITLLIRIGFHPAAIGLSASPLSDAELWTWSGAWLLYASALTICGAWRNHRILRLIALGMLALVCAKVFLVDMAQLAGLWRVLSLLGLGLALIGLGTLHRRWLMPDPGAQVRIPG
jgi:uncharacterized membrane protein